MKIPPAHLDPFKVQQSARGDTPKVLHCGVLKIRHHKNPKPQYHSSSPLLVFLSDYDKVYSPQILLSMQFRNENEDTNGFPPSCLHGSVRGGDSSVRWAGNE